MNICDKCGYKVVSNAMFKRHEATHVVPDGTQEEVKEVVQEVQEVEEVRYPEEITLNFAKQIEVYINGKPYVGQEIVVKDMEIASEIVRIAREAYGPAILA